MKREPVLVRDDSLGKHLHQLIEELPPKLRDPFILRFLHDKSYKAIAFQLTLTEATVRKRVQYARQKLRKPLRQYISGLSDATVLANLQTTAVV